MCINLLCLILIYHSFQLRIGLLALCSHTSRRQPATVEAQSKKVSKIIHSWIASCFRCIFAVISVFRPAFYVIAAIIRPNLSFLISSNRFFHFYYSFIYLFIFVYLFFIYLFIYLFTYSFIYLFIIAEIPNFWSSKRMN